MNTHSIFICWTCFSSLIQYLFEDYCEEIFYFQLKDVHFFLYFEWSYTTSKFAKYIKSITNIIQVWWLCIWKVISVSLLCIIYKPVIVKCVVKKMLCLVKSLCFCFIVLVFLCQCTGIVIILREAPLKTITSSRESIFEMNLKKKCSYHYKIMLLLKNAK